MGRGKSGAGVCGAQSPVSAEPARTMLAPTCFLCLLAAAAAAPATFDQRQDGDFNVRADVQNVVLLVAVPNKMSFPLGIFSKSAKRDNHNQIQERSDFRVMEAFVEPSNPYHVEIGGGGDREAEGSGRGIEVVIAGRRRVGGPEPQAEPDEYKLLGATEQCGPDQERDPLSLACHARSHDADPTTVAAAADNTSKKQAQGDLVKELASKPSPEVIPSSP